MAKFVQIAHSPHKPLLAQFVPIAINRNYQNSLPQKKLPKVAKMYYKIIATFGKLKNPPTNPNFLGHFCPSHATVTIVCNR